MGISSISSKALISFGILGAISAYAVDIADNKNFTDNFRSNNGNWSVKADSKIKDEGVTLKGGLTEFENPINTITLTTDKKITIEANTEVGHYTDKANKDKIYGFIAIAKEGIDNKGDITVLRDSKITANTTLQTNSNLDILGSQLDIIGNVDAKNNTNITLATPSNADINIIHIFDKLIKDKVTLDNSASTIINTLSEYEDHIRIANTLGNNTNTLGVATLNIRGNLKTEGNTTFNFYNDGFINVSGKATINSQNGLNIITKNSPLSDDKTLLFAKGGVDIVETNNTSILQQQSDKTWKPSSGGSIDVTYEREVASYLSKPSLLDGIIVDAVDNLTNDNYIYEVRVDEKKNNIFVKVNVDNSKINTTNLKDSKTISEFLKNQLTTLSVGEKKNLETAKNNLENAKQTYNQTNISNKAQIIKNIEEALKDIEGKIQATNTFNNTNTTTKDILSVLVKGADARVAENVLVTLVNKKDNKLLATLNTATLKDTTTSISQSGNTQEALSILNALSTSNINTNGVLSAITHENFFKDTRTQGQVATQTSNTSSQLGAINVANDMAIGDRIARFNNPYIETKRFAALSSDAAYNYYDEYKSSLWANAFGGLNIIGDNDGGFYGITAGIDRNINTNFLLGGYFTYANSTLKSITNKQQSNNYQLGLYTLIKFAQDWEVGGKAYTQLSPTNQYDYNPLGTDSADFTRRLFGFNGGIGKVFQISNAFFIKPFGGVNYYYSFTPNYAQSGTALAKKIRSLTNNALSLEAGLEARQYFGANSYFYLTPKLEQYVVNNGDDYIARFAGSTSVFKISNDEKKKTYGQLTFGGNVYIKENLSLNIGGGIKQILAGKSNSTNETYLSINTGLKYKF